MKITDVRLLGFTAPCYIGPDKDGHSHPCKQRKGAFAVLNIDTDEGVTGEYTFATTRPAPSADYNPDVLETCGDSESIGNLAGAIRRLRPVLIGEDPRCRERIVTRMTRMQRLYFDLTDPVLAMVDCALWDLLGKLAGMPVFRLLGGHRTRVAAYGSIMVGDDIPGGLCVPEDYARYAKQLVARGYTAIKLHTWMDEPWDERTYSGKPDPEKDVAACAAVREAVGPGVPLMLDAFHGYSRQEALYIGRELEKLNFCWIEEPMDEYSLSSYRWLCDHLDLPVCGPETMLGKQATRAEWIREGAADIIRAGARDVGGLTVLQKIVHLCEAYQMPMDLHGPEPANVSMLTAVTYPYGYVERGLLHPFLDYDATPPWMHTPYDCMDSRGDVIVSEKPGFGLDLDYAYIRDHAITE